MPARLTLRTILDRLTVGDGCWTAEGSPTQGGYIQISNQLGSPYMHRLMHEVFVGPIPEGLTIDHLCRNRGCCNFAHGEPVTQRVNLLRGDTLPAANAVKTQCPQGHEYDLLNTHVTKQGRRHCRACDRDRHNAAYARRRAAA